MNNHYLFIIVFILLFVVIQNQKRRQRAVINAVKKKKLAKGSNKMHEFAKQFIGKDCLIYTMESNMSNISGVIKEVNDNALVIENKNSDMEIINLDYVIRIREYPKNKNGKKKSVILD